MINVHPFPARMAPELALNMLGSVERGSVVLDPMTGSGTVLQQARGLNLSALGFDLDPLAVLISKVSTTPVKDEAIDLASKRIMTEAKSLHEDSIELPWMDGDERTEQFVGYWFGDMQRDDLRRLACVLARASEYGIADSVADVLRVALSRIIITKKAAASLAQDTSHSRPHKVLTESDYDVMDGYGRSVRALRKRLLRIPESGSVDVGQGDARDLRRVEDQSVDLVLTSPPYLNAIDYMRGHKMSLVWLGYGLDELTKKRASSIGAERKPDTVSAGIEIQNIMAAIGDTSTLPGKYVGMIQRYAIDLREMLNEVARVLKRRATATFVMGNSCLKGVYIQNSQALVTAAEASGLRFIEKWERDLPPGSRYLPTPESGHLSKRMRKEVIVRLEKR
jgi:DNA modification methylase